HTINAVYSGDSNFQGVTGTGTVSVVLAPTVTVTTNNANPGNNGVSVTETVAVTGTGATPTGTVAFYVNSLLVQANVPLDGTGHAAVNLTTSLLQQAGVTLLPGLQSISVVYSGDSVYASGTGVYEQAVQANTFNLNHKYVYRVGDGTTSLIAPTGNPNAGSAS